MTPAKGLAVLFLAALIVAWAGAAIAGPLLLEVVLNGRRTGHVCEFIERGGAIFAKASDLTDLGFVLPAQLKGLDEVALADLPGVQASVNAQQQTLVVTAPDTALVPTTLGDNRPEPLAPITPASLGAVLNYDASATASGRTMSGGVLLDGRVFGPEGVIQSGAVVNFDPIVGQSAFVRLDTTYTYSQPDESRRWRVGDVVTGALAWTRAVQLGGVQVVSDFTMRPDLITYPLPTISSSTAVPSTVDVVANGVREFSQAVQPGPFQVSTLPVVTGAGQVAVTVTDALGRQTVISMPFYASTTLLRTGLASYSLELGSVRRDYGLASNDYVGEAESGSVRYGLNDQLTLEAHGESTAGLVLAGGGAAVQVGTFGVLNGAVAISTGHGALRVAAASPPDGALVSVGFQRLSRTLTFNVNVGLATPGYRDIAAVTGAPMPTLTLSAGVGYELGRFGSIAASYVDQRAGLPGLGLAPGANFAADVNPSIKLLSGSYSVPVAHRFAVYASVYDDLGQARSYGGALGVSFRLGRDVSVSTNATDNAGMLVASVEADKPALAQNSFGFRLQDTEGANPDRSAQVEYLASWSRLSAGVDDSRGMVSERVGALGAFVVDGGQFFASDEIDDSFAVVKTGDVPGVPVLYENRVVGVTNSHGVLLVPLLRSFENNKIALDPLSLPVDIELDQASTVVRPSDRSGLVVDFHVRRAMGALVKLRDEASHPIAIGAVAHIDGAPDVPVGYDGEAYATGLKPHNLMRVDLPDGKRCLAQFDYVPVKGDIPVIGPVVCRVGP